MTAKSEPMSIEEVLALPASVGMQAACRALGISSSKGYELVRLGKFPCRVLPVGDINKVPRTEIFRVLGIEAPSVARAS